MLVKEIMTRNVVAVRPDTTLKELTRLLIDNRINGVPVVTGENRIAGVITMTDLLKILRDINYWDSIEKIKPGIGVKEALVKEKEYIIVEKKMSRNVSTVSEDDSVDHVIDIMCKHNIHTIPVVKDDKLVGVIGATDIVKICFL